MAKKLEAIHNHIIFQFEDGMSRQDRITQFKQTVKEGSLKGFEIVNHKESLNDPRWGIVISVGEKAQEYVQPGMRILIEALKWTTEAKFEGQGYWRTDVGSVLAIDDGYNAE